MIDRQALTRSHRREVHDFWPRVIASPALGALVVNLSGLIDHARHSSAGLVGSYAWFAARGGQALRASGVARWLERIFGTALVVFGLRLLAARR